MGAFIVTVIGAIFLGVFVIVLIWFITKTNKGQQLMSYISKAVEKEEGYVNIDNYEHFAKEYKTAELSERERLAPIIGQLVEECKKKEQTSKVTLKSYKTIELDEIIPTFEQLPVLELYHILKVLEGRVK